jgi:hypothetical protein
MGRKDISNDSGSEYIARNGKSGQETGEDEQACRLANCCQNDTEDEQDVGDVEGGVTAVDVGKWRDEEGATCFTEFPDCDEEDTGRAVFVAF